MSFVSRDWGRAQDTLWLVCKHRLLLDIASRSWSGKYSTNGVHYGGLTPGLRGRGHCGCMWPDRQKYIDKEGEGGGVVTEEGVIPFLNTFCWQLEKLNASPPPPPPQYKDPMTKKKFGGLDKIEDLWKHTYVSQYSSASFPSVFFSVTVYSTTSCIETCNYACAKRYSLICSRTYRRRKWWGQGAGVPSPP